MKKFKGIILAGGKGSRLSPITDVYNKYLCPIYDKLMIEYSILSLKNAGVTDIAIILGTKSAGETMDYLKSGSKYSVKFTYFYQDEPLGVPNALYQAKEWAGCDPVVVVCADNIIYDDLSVFLNKYKSGAFITIKMFLDKNDLKRFAVLDFEDSNDFTTRVTKIIEKPLIPPSYFAFCGIQIYDPTVWDIIEDLELSPRGEYEIVDVLNKFIEMAALDYDILTDKFFDCGNKDALFEAQQYAYNRSLEDK